MARDYSESHSGCQAFARLLPCPGVMWDRTKPPYDCREYACKFPAFQLLCLCNDSGMMAATCSGPYR